LFAPFRFATNELRFAVADEDDFLTSVKSVADQVFVTAMKRRELADNQAALKAFAHGTLKNRRQRTSATIAFSQNAA
jgi:hypothetical protein